MMEEEEYNVAHPFTICSLAVLVEVVKSFQQIRIEYFEKLQNELKKKEKFNNEIAQDLLEQIKHMDGKIGEAEDILKERLSTTITTNLERKKEKEEECMRMNERGCELLRNALRQNAILQEGIAPTDYWRF